MCEYIKAKDDKINQKTKFKPDSSRIICNAKWKHENASFRYIFFYKNIWQPNSQQAPKHPAIF